MTDLLKEFKNLVELIEAGDYSKIVVLADTNTASYCVPVFCDGISIDHLITVANGEAHKTIETCNYVWGKMTDLGLDRHALLVNIGGGVITDLGGFCASAYKRGIDFIQVPTSLLAMVDAAIGGKTGVDFQGYKNQIGVFAQPRAIYIHPPFLDTLPQDQWVSGYAEVYKHALIEDAHFWNDLCQMDIIDPSMDWVDIIDRAVQIKVSIVEKDPLEKGVRKALNFGHTIGHGVESYQLDKDDIISHGLAVAIGIICESFLSAQRGFISIDNRTLIVSHIKSIFDLIEIKKADYNKVYDYCLGDKKNKDGKILCTMIGPVGQFKINQEINKLEIINALTYYNSIL